MPDKAQLTSDNPIAWSGGDLFNGHVVLLMALPSTGGNPWGRVMLRNVDQRLSVPVSVKVPIR
jgi:hypothetical protein